MRTVLIVEDELLEQEFLHSIVRDELGETQRILTCETGVQAVSLAREHRPELIIMDILIPEMDGLKAMQEIRTFLPEAVLLIVSACSDFAYAQTAITCRAFEYMLKPVKPAIFRDVIARAHASVTNKPTYNERRSALGSIVMGKEPVSSIGEAVKYIKDNFKEKLTLEAVAEKVHMNPQYFSRVFKKEMGVTYTEYVNELKIECACQLLETTNYPAYRISWECGFTDPSYFNRVFCRKKCVTPREYKKRFVIFKGGEGGR